MRVTARLFRSADSFVASFALAVSRINRVLCHPTASDYS